MRAKQFALYAALSLLAHAVVLVAVMHSPARPFDRLRVSGGRVVPIVSLTPVDAARSKPAAAQPPRSRDVSLSAHPELVERSSVEPLLPRDSRAGRRSAVTTHLVGPEPGAQPVRHSRGGGNPGNSPNAVTSLPRASGAASPPAPPELVEWSSGSSNLTERVPTDPCWNAVAHELDARARSQIPEAVKRRFTSGRATVLFNISSGGRIVGAKIATSSGKPLLDELVLKLFETPLQAPAARTCEGPGKWSLRLEERRVN